MTSVQDKFFRVLRERAERDGYEVAVAKDWANCGLLHLQAPDSFETALTVRFDFQPDRASFGDMCANTNPGRVPHARPIFRTRPNPWYAGFTAGELDEAIDMILAAAKRPREED